MSNYANRLYEIVNRAEKELRGDSMKHEVINQFEKELKEEFEAQAPIKKDLLEKTVEKINDYFNNILLNIIDWETIIIEINGQQIIFNFHNTSKARFAIARLADKNYIINTNGYGTRPYNGVPKSFEDMLKLFGLKTRSGKDFLKFFLANRGIIEKQIETQIKPQIENKLDKKYANLSDYAIQEAEFMDLMKEYNA